MLTWLIRAGHIILSAVTFHYIAPDVPADNRITCITKLLLKINVVGFLFEIYYMTAILFMISDHCSFTSSTMSSNDNSVGLKIGLLPYMVTLCYYRREYCMYAII